MVPNMDLSIIIPTYNRNDILYKHLAIAYTELKDIHYEIIVVNDFKTNNVYIPVEWQNRIAVYDNPKQGVASARNYGASLAKADFLLFIDDDVILNRMAVLNALEFLSTNKGMCLNVDWIYPKELTTKLDTYQFGRYLEHFDFTSLKGWMGKDFAWQQNALFKTTSAASYFLAIAKTDFEKSGRYDENFPFAGFEDHDFATRLETSGICTYLDTRVLVWHNEEDRVQIDGWMQRKYRGGQTRKVAVTMGHKELALDFDNLKGKVYYTISKTEFIFNTILKLIPNHKIFDPLYFKIVNILLGVNLYKGYTK